MVVERFGERGRGRGRRSLVRKSPYASLTLAAPFQRQDKGYPVLNTYPTPARAVEHCPRPPHRLRPAIRITAIGARLLQALNLAKPISSPSWRAERRSPSKAGEAGEVVIKGDPF